MGPWKIAFESSAVKDIKKLPPAISKRIGIKLRWFATQPHPLVYATKLVGDGMIGDYRYRVGDYRILFDADEVTQSIIVRTVMHRREVYRGR